MTQEHAFKAAELCLISAKRSFNCRMIEIIEYTIKKRCLH